MQHKSNKRWILLGSILIAVGVGGYFLYKAYKKRKDKIAEKKRIEDEQKSSSAPSSSTSTPTSTSTSTPTSTTTTTTTSKPIDPKVWKPKDRVYLRGQQSAVFSYPDTKYVLGRVTKKVFLDKAIGVYASPVNNFYSKIVLVGYEPINTTTGGWMGMKYGTREAYIATSNIQKTPY